MIARLALPGQVLIGGGALAELPTVAAGLGIARPLVVSDPVMREMGLTDRVAALLDDSGARATIFTDTVPEPTTIEVERGAALLRESQFDGLIALGGGSPIDTAKAMAVLAANGGRLRDYKVPNPIPLKGAPLIAIPTTAGTGSEVTRFTVVTDAETDEKMLIAGPSVTPAAAIVDWELAVTMPPRLTADTGIDALTHAIEAYVSRKANPFSDTMALSAMRRIYANIRTACHDGRNAAARAAMMQGATEAGMAFSNASVALVHGMSRPIGAFFHVPHGLSNAMLLPEVTAFSAPAALQRYAECAAAMGIAAVGEGDQAAVARLVDALRTLNRDLDVPTPARFGIDRARYFEIVPTMAAQALASGSPANNPRVPTAEEMVELYGRVFG